MSILSINGPLVGAQGIKPVIYQIDTNDTYAEITTAGYLPNNNNYTNNAIVLITNETYHVSALILTIDEDGIITLSPSFSSGGVTLPVTSGHIAVFSGTTGLIGDDVSTAINGGNIHAGLSGTAGNLTSFPSTASKGNLRITAIDNTGNTVTTVSNAAMGQACTISIPDPGAATANFLLSSGANSIAVGSSLSFATSFGTGNTVTINAQAGVITTAALSTAAGASQSITLNNSMITANSVIVATAYTGGTNTTKGIIVECAQPTSTQAVINVFNAAAAALNGTIRIAFFIAS